MRFVSSDSNYGATVELANILSWPDFDCLLSLQKPPLTPALSR